MCHPAFAFDHRYIISQSPQDAANWYVQMCGAEIVADTVARATPHLSLALGGKTRIMRGQRPGEALTAAPAIQPYADYSSHNTRGLITAASAITATGAPSATSCAPKGCAFPWPCRQGRGCWLWYVAAPDGVSIELMEGRRPGMA
jgi:hypothetical protein